LFLYQYWIHPVLGVHECPGSILQVEMTMNNEKTFRVYRPKSMSVTWTPWPVRAQHTFNSEEGLLLEIVSRGD